MALAGSEATFDSLYARFKWEEIPNCPGRYVLARGSEKKELSTKTSNSLVGDNFPAIVFQSQICRDPIHIIRFASGGGLLSYEHVDRNCYTHTLNTPSGLIRKMKHLEISFSD
jgi:hypothetical protein